MSLKKMKFTNSRDKVLRSNLYIQHRVSLEDLAVLLANHVITYGVRLMDGEWVGETDLKYMNDMAAGDLWTIIRETLEEKGSDSYGCFRGVNTEPLAWARRQVKMHIPQGVKKEVNDAREA